MRKLISFNMISLDGFFAGPDGDIEWHNVDEEFNQFAIEQTSQFGTFLFGRVTYQLMASYWPTPAGVRDDPQVAAIMNSLPKVVVSTTLQEATWHNTRLIKDNLTEEILQLKQQPGLDIAVFGSANLLASLVRLDLIDEHRVMVNPIILGKGQPLFINIDHRLKLELVESRLFQSGNILLYYRPVNGEL